MRSSLEIARSVVEAEANALLRLAESIDEQLELAIQAVLECRGRVVVTGVGKAGAIARKVAATLASTGTPAVYLHPAEGVHGDLGMVVSGDLVIALSTSGESDELLRLLPSLRTIGVTLVVMTGNAGSSLALAAQIVVPINIDGEACPLGLAPTTSAVALLAMGDALAMAVMDARGFTQSEFAVYHPAGALGRRVTLRVADIMRTGDQLAAVPLDTTVLNAMLTISAAKAGTAVIVDATDRVQGLLTDGDIRRALIQDRNSLDLEVRSLMNCSPVVISGNPLVAEACEAFGEEARAPGEVPVVDSEGKLVGMVNMKDMFRLGVV